MRSASRSKRSIACSRSTRPTGRLEVEAGARIGDVQRFALARGWYLPVAPGHPAATIGGCIAADVHGKNPARDGTFRSLVERIELCTAGGEVVVARPVHERRSLRGDIRGLRPHRHDHARDAASGAAAGRARDAARAGRESHRRRARAARGRERAGAVRLARRAARTLRPRRDPHRACERCRGRDAAAHSVGGERSSATRRADAVHAVEPRRHRGCEYMARLRAGAAPARRRCRSRLRCFR